ncbi:MAG: hypothetical protein IPJ85_05020 [Flavobacteriales bacterium]|nr:hypothetical protein [Flavobacteriales bacterium]
MIKRYDAQWVWKQRPFEQAGPAAPPWPESLIGRIGANWDWAMLSSIGTLPWSIALIERYHDNWDWKALARNIGAYDAVVKPYADDAFVVELMRRIADSRMA